MTKAEITKAETRHYMCLAISPDPGHNYCCTRDADHPGPHSALDEQGRSLASWPLTKAEIRQARAAARAVGLPIALPLSIPTLTAPGIRRRR